MTLGSLGDFPVENPPVLPNRDFWRNLKLVTFENNLIKTSRADLEKKSVFVFWRVDPNTSYFVTHYLKRPVPSL